MDIIISFSILIVLFSASEILNVICDIKNEKDVDCPSIIFGFISSLICFIFGFVIFIKSNIIYDELNIKRVEIFKKEYTICENPSEIEIEKVKYIVCGDKGNK